MSTEPIEPEVIEDRAVVLRHPSVPTTINELAAMGGVQGLAIIEQRTKIFHAMRMASIALTFPNDWTLFKDREGRITAYLGDQGCDRIKKMWGIQVNNLGTMTRLEDAEHPGEFAFSITGDGTCGLTGEAVFDMEGIRYSTEKYATEKPEGIQRTVAVQKAARANLDGGITRELAGMKSVPAQELDKAWEGTWKKTELANKGRGFGSGDERAGGEGDKTGVAPQDIPVCPFCQPARKLVLRPAKGNRGAFWGCQNYESHPNDKVYVDHAKLLQEIAKKKTAAPAPAGDEQ